MKLKAVTFYEASDGTAFGDLADAMKHEKHLALSELVYNQVAVEDSQAIAEFIYNNFDTITQLLMADPKVEDNRNAPIA